jgi:hypothetical protein
MADATLWVKLRDAPRLSWHLVIEGVTTERIFTRCGREITFYPCPWADDLPLVGKSCETCLRLKERDQEKAGA